MNWFKPNQTCKGRAYGLTCVTCMSVWVTSYLGLGLGQINWHKFPLFMHFITKLCYIHPSQKTTPVTRQWRKWKLTRRWLRGCEPGQDSQPPNTPKQKTKWKTYHHKTKQRDGGTPKTRTAEWVSWCADLRTHILWTPKWPIQPVSHVLQKKPVGGGWVNEQVAGERGRSKPSQSTVLMP